MKEEKKLPPSRSTRHLDPHEKDRTIVEFRDDLEHERDRRYALTDSVLKKRKNSEVDRGKDRADDALAQLQVERDVRPSFKSWEQLAVRSLS